MSTLQSMLDSRQMDLRTMAQYAREIRPILPAEASVPARSRILWLPVHLAVIVTLAWLMATARAPGWTWPLASLIIGCSLGGLTFLGHETMHGGVIRGRMAIKLVGWICFLPFVMSPTLWTAWHNRVHHNHCGKAGVDPDMYPTLEEYRTQRAARIMADYFGIGRRRLMGFLSLLVGFTGQSQQMLWTSKKRGFLTPTLHRRAILETLLGVAFWVAVAYLVGWPAFAFVYVLPLVVVNTIVMAFIMTNHNLSPLTAINDPLVNSLSVTLPRPLVWLTLGFGYHTEHHLFPTMSTRHGPAIRDAILAKYPERYQSIPMSHALVQLYQTARVYRDDVTLIDPPTGLTWPTIQPRDPNPPTNPLQRA